MTDIPGLPPQAHIQRMVSEMHMRFADFDRWVDGFLETPRLMKIAEIQARWPQLAAEQAEWLHDSFTCFLLEALDAGNPLDWNGHVPE
jgi:hypothetical protein